MVSESSNIISHLTYREWHAFANGFYKGIVGGGRKHDYTQEKHYWRGGYLLGAAVRYGAVLALGRQFSK